MKDQTAKQHPLPSLRALSISRRGLALIVPAALIGRVRLVSAADSPETSHETPERLLRVKSPSTRQARWNARIVYWAATLAVVAAVGQGQPAQHPGHHRNP